MDFVLFVYIYFGFTAFLVFVLLFGESPAFSGTPLSFFRYLLTEAWVVALEWVVDKAFGNRGLRMLDRATECCCESSNPALQIAYLLLYTFGYGLYWQYIFKLLPNQFAAEYHLYTGTAVVMLTLALFLKASMSNPGRLTQANAAVYSLAYPVDGLLFPAKECSSCALMRPGRSKHCSACGSCIVRFDHHCGWINNCVGLHNTRDFLAFLLANFAVCVYGSSVAVATVAGELHKRGFFDIYVYDPKLQNRVPLYRRPARFAEWVMVYYPIPVALVMFQVVAGGLMLVFFMYQGYLISEGRTTYETFKRNQLMKDRQALAAVRAAHAAAVGGGGAQEQQQQLPKGLKERLAGENGQTCKQSTFDQQLLLQDQKPKEGLFNHQAAAASNHAGRSSSKGMRGLGLLCWWQQRDQVEPVVNCYDRGLLSNWYEVLFPDAFLQQYRSLLDAVAGDGNKAKKQ